MAPTALITGATGLIGMHVVRQWDIPGLEPVLADRRADNLLRPGAPTALVQRVNPDVVVHLAWTASGSLGYRTSPDQDQWVDASLELARVCREAGIWFVATGTAVDRVDTTSDAYSAAKVRLRRTLEPAIRAGDVTWLRPFYVIDPTRRRPALVAEALEAGGRGATLALRSPESLHDFIHASDVGQAVLVAVRHRLRGEVQIGSGRLRRVRDLVHALGVRWEVAPNPLDTGPQYHEAADSGRLRDLGWSPRLTEKLFDGG